MFFRNEPDENLMNRCSMMSMPPTGLQLTLFPFLPWIYFERFHSENTSSFTDLPIGLERREWGMVDMLRYGQLRSKRQARKTQATSSYFHFVTTL